MSIYISMRSLMAVTTVIAAMATGSAGVAGSDSENDDKVQMVPYGYGPYGGGMGMMGRLFDSDGDDIGSMFQMMPYGYGPYGGGMGMMSRPIDTDGDGIVSAEEASTHASSGFAQYDADDDGQISEDEYMDSASLAMPISRRNVERRYVNRTERFKGMDADGNGDVTLAEFVAKAKESYDAADADKDGKVTVWEFRAQQNPF